MTLSRGGFLERTVNDLLRWACRGINMVVSSKRNENKWEFCIDHYNDAVSEFFEQHFSEKHRQCLFIGSAGFDPRSNIIVEKLCPIIDKRIHVILIREKRSISDTKLVKRAKENIAEVERSIFPKPKS